MRAEAVHGGRAEQHLAGASGLAQQQPNNEDRQEHSQDDAQGTRHANPEQQVRPQGQRHQRQVEHTTEGVAFAPTTSVGHTAP